MGNTKQALWLIMEKMDDVDEAIEFAKEHDDSELWDDLIAYSIDKPCKFAEIYFPQRTANESIP